ncbi:unnamed protein product [Gongylonema pulchrum]|uniref:Helicase POLQ-like n=1 Tax=Gongylonema pulchrum TaxID=637853 RepID=A0A183DWQ9_9BILA|nr:unnamed protein product [Gongylonema pulchrum]
MFIGRLPPIKRRGKQSIYVATIEKANMLVNSLIEENRIEEVGVVVVDELHMIGEEVRGAAIEQTLLKYMHKGAGQIIGLSATLSNIEQLARFLCASVFSTEFRPVRLIEKVKIGSSLYLVTADRKLEFQSDLGENKLLRSDPEGLVPLLSDVLPRRSVLIFCPTKLNCENVCGMLARLMPRNVRERKKAERLCALEVLREEQDGKLCALLEKSFLRGVAYHHSGLTADERRIVENAFQDGVINVICCTSTLAAGVNLPARRVIIKTPLVGKEPLRKAQYLQMIGRAGRAGYDCIGEAVTILHPGTQETKFLEMISGPLLDCKSSLSEPSLFASFLLDLIFLKIAQTKEELECIVQKTLFGIQNENSKELVAQTLDYLKNHDLICIDTGIILSSDFHLIFIVVPFNLAVTIDWDIFYDEYISLSKYEQILLAQLGLNDKELIKCFILRPKLKEGEAPMRLYISLMLHRLWKQETLYDVAERFHVSRGWLQNALQATYSQASSIIRFAEVSH